MRERVRFIEDLARVASGAVGAATGVRDEVEQMVRQRFERVAADLDLVSREDFQAVEAMAEAARLENETLKERLTALEARIESLEKAPAKKPAPARKPAAKASTKSATTSSTTAAKPKRTAAAKPRATSKATSKTADK